MKRIRAQHELVELAAELGVRSDWHEPNDRGVTARVEGSNFNNAGFWPAENRPFSAPEIIELHVIISRNGEDVAATNLATLLAWASAPGEASRRETTASASGGDGVTNIMDPGEALRKAAELAAEAEEYLTKRDGGQGLRLLSVEDRVRLLVGLAGVYAEIAHVHSRSPHMS